MKTLIFILIACVVVVSSREGKKRCSSADECDKETECCIEKVLGIFFKGECKPRAKKDEACEENTKYAKGVYRRRCPCESGLICKEEEDDNPFPFLDKKRKCEIDQGTTSEPQTEAPETEAPETEAPETEAPETEGPAEE